MPDKHKYKLSTNLRPHTNPRFSFENLLLSVGTGWKMNLEIGKSEFLATPRAGTPWSLQQWARYQMFKKMHHKCTFLFSLCADDSTEKNQFLKKRTNSPDQQLQDFPFGNRVWKNLPLKNSFQPSSNFMLTTSSKFTKEVDCGWLSLSPAGSTLSWVKYMFSGDAESSRIKLIKIGPTKLKVAQILTQNGLSWLDFQFDTNCNSNRPKMVQGDPQWLKLPKNGSIFLTSPRVELSPGQVFPSSSHVMIHEWQNLMLEKDENMTFSTFWMFEQSSPTCGHS